MSDTVIAYSKISATDLYGKVMKHEWWWNGVKIWEYTWPTLTEHWNYACYWTYWPEFGNSNEPGSGYIKIIVDGVYLGQTNTFIINPPSGVYAQIVSVSPDYKLIPGQFQLVTGRVIKNIGTNQGYLYTRLYADVGLPSEYILVEDTINAPPGQNMEGGINFAVPSTSQTWHLGFKVRGASEDWQDWGGDRAQTWDAIIGTCEYGANQTVCQNAGCYWYDNSCHSTAPCSYYTTQSTCLSAGCYWWNGSCHSSAPTCSDLNNKVDCEHYMAGCYWYNNSCHSTPQQTGICDWVTAHGGATGLDVAEVFQIIDSYVLQTPPTGYTFVSTLTQVFGIIDYYLGFIASGNEKTGCSF